MTPGPRLAMVVLLVALAGCSGVSDANVTCQGTDCRYTIEASSFPENTSILVREGDQTVEELDRRERVNGTVERGVNVTAYRVNWENETIRRAVTCYTFNETCTFPPTVSVGTPTDGGDL